MVRSIARRWAFIVTGCGVLAGHVLTAPAAVAQNCPDVEVIFARGTFEPPGVGTTGQAFVDALRSKIGQETMGVDAVDYPASLDFHAAADGVIDAMRRLRDITTRCPRTGVVLGGYSQGAAVAAYVTSDTVPVGYDLPPGLTEPLPAEVADHIVAVALFGKPSAGFLAMIAPGSPPITTGTRFAAKTIDLCIAGDPVCSTGGGDGAHNAYAVNGMTDEAADYAATRLATAAVPTLARQTSRATS